MIRLVMAIMLAATVATAQDWSTLGAFWVQPRGGAASVLGGAVDLDGSSEYFSDIQTNLLHGASACTFAAWVYPRSYTDYAGICFNYMSGGYDSGIRLWSAASKAANFSVTTSATTPSSRWATSPNNSIVTGAWTHIVGVYPGSGATRIYINGSSTTGEVSSGTVRQVQEVKIGWDTYSVDRKFNGFIDEAAIWSRALTSNEVAELYNSGVGKPVNQLSTGTNGLVRYWKLDDGLTNPSATNAYDSASGTYATGTAIGSGDWTNGIIPIN